MRLKHLANPFLFVLLVSMEVCLLATYPAVGQAVGDAGERNRPQEPIPPYPYQVVDVVIPAGSGVELAGTLTLPYGDGQCPAALLVTGAGAQDRDETLAVPSHKPFLVLADHLTRNGIAVLRLDDRGVGDSTGSFEDATVDHMVEDIARASRYLAKHAAVASQKVGIIGHSKGGAMGPLAASHPEACVNYLVLLAAPGVPIAEILVQQDDDQARVQGVSESERQRHKALLESLLRIVGEEGDTPIGRQRARSVMLAAVAELSEAQRKVAGATDYAMNREINELFSNSVRRLLTHDPASVLRSIEAPVLALCGERDLQVNARVNLTAIQQALSEANNPDFLVVAKPGLNHLFQNCRTGLPDEYGEIEETFDTETLQEISTWILDRFPRD